MPSNTRGLCDQRLRWRRHGMREIVTFAVGQAGNQIGSAFWETILKEHGLNNEGVRIGVRRGKR